MSERLTDDELWAEVEAVRSMLMGARGGKTAFQCVVKEARRARSEETRLREENETLRRDLDAWGHDRDCARLQARGRPNDDRVACDCTLESYRFGR